MSPRLTKHFPVLTAAAFVTTLLAAPSAGWAQGPFANLAGAWSGSGSIAMSNGSSERIRCRVNYEVSGNSLRQDLRCASDSYRFDLTSNLQSEGNSVSGNWTETSRGVGGFLRGQASGGTINGLVESSGFSATIAISTKGAQQSVSIKSQGEVREVSITMRKGG